MIVYLCVLIILFLVAFINNRNQITSINSSKKSYAVKKNNSEKLFFLVTLIYLLMALKSYVTGDYSRYAINFINATYKSITDMASIKGEIGFHTFTKIITYITSNVRWYFAITSAFICISLGIFIQKNADNKIYSLFFYYTIGLFAFSLAGLRQALAMSICLFAFKAIKDKKCIKFILIVGFAFLFHKSAAFFLLAYPIARFKWKRNNILIVAALYGIVCVFFKKLYSAIAQWLGYDNYGIESTGNGGIFLVVLIVIGILCLIYKNKLILKNSQNIIFINLHFAVLAIWIFRLFTRTVERPAYYYLYATIIILDKILSLQFDSYTEESTQKIVLITSLILFGLFFVYRLSRDLNLIPYIFI